MNKSVSSPVAMSGAADSLLVAQNLLTTLLGLQPTMGRPSEEVCNLIAGLQGLAEIGVKTGNSDWRRGVNTMQQQTLPRWRNNASPVSSPIRSVASNGSLESAGSGRYQSRFRNSHQPVEDKILNNIILSKLNKFSEATYPEVRDFLYQILGSGEKDLQEFVRDFMRLVFRKAASEEIFCPLYARLLTEISSKYSVILEEMNILSDGYLVIFEEITEDNTTNYEAFVQKNVEKKYRLGYSQFLAELVKQEILSLNVLEITFGKLLALFLQNAKDADKKNLLDEYVDCLLRMTRVLKGRSTKFSRSAREALLPAFAAFFEEIQTHKDLYPSCSSKSRFVLMDIHDILKPVRS